MKRYVWLAASLLTGSTVVGVLSARAPTAQAYGEALSTREVQKLVPHYPGAQLLDLGGPVHVDGQSRRLAYALTPDAPRKVAERYAGVFASQGLKVEERTVGQEYWVTASSLQDGLIRTIAAAPNPQGTVILASVTRLFDQATELPLSLPPHCAVVTRTGGNDSTSQTEMVLARCQAPMAAVVNYFERLYSNDTQKHRLGDNQSFLHYTTPKREVMVGIEPVPNVANQSMLTIHWQERQ